jgi:hypothetical protein
MGDGRQEWSAGGLYRAERAPPVDHLFLLRSICGSVVIDVPSWYAKSKSPHKPYETQDDYADAWITMVDLNYSKIREILKK